MKSFLGSYICGERLKQKLNTVQLAEKVGYRNTNKGMRRIIDLEREGKVHNELLEKVVDVLKLDAGYIDSLTMKDREAYEAETERWLNEPIRKYYTIRMMPTIYLSYDLPSNIETEDEAIYFVSDIAKNKKCLAWVNFSRRETVCIDKSGRVTGRYENGLHDTSMPYLLVR